MGHDTWEKTENALLAARKLVALMCEQKPSQKDNPIAYKQWRKEMDEVDKWCVSIHNRRIALNMKG